MPKLWNKGYNLNKEIEKFTVGDDYIIDKNILKYDIYASIAHAKMLNKIKILDNNELAKLKKGLKSILNLDSKGKFEIKIEDEDCHTAIENYLIKSYGVVGKKIHTGRSRNDQLLVALRLYEKDKILKIMEAALNLAKVLINFSKKNQNIPMPGYTHMQKAMPSSLGLWSSAFAESLLDDINTLNNCYAIINQNPLGSAASYGTNLNLDREYTSDLLGFGKVQNVLYSANSRGKFESYIVSCLAQVMLTLNKIANDLMLFTMQEFNYFELPKEFCTGSSIMPQKKNYDVLELLRAKYHVVNSLQFQINGIISNLISGYNRDLQLTKKPVIEALEITENCLNIGSLIFGKLKVNKKDLENSMTNDLFATDEAYELVKKGVPFRDAYKKVAKNLQKIKIKKIKTIKVDTTLLNKEINEKFTNNKKFIHLFHSKIKNLINI